MAERIEEIRALFFNNYEKIKGAYPWENTCIYPVCASFYTQEEREVNIEALNEEKRRIKLDTGIFSCFRGNLRFPIATLLSLEKDPETLLKHMLGIHKKLREFCKPTLELAAVSCVFSLKEQPLDFEKIKQNVIEWKVLLKDSSKGVQDLKQLPYLFLLAASNQPYREVEKRFLRLVKELTPYFRNQRSSIAVALCLCKEDRDPNQIVADFVELLHILKSYDACSGSITELAVLCMLLEAGGKKDEIATHIIRNREEFQKKEYFSSMDSGVLQKNFYSMVLEVMNQSLGDNREEKELFIMTELLTFVALPELIENMER